ncbi:MAG: outer membrane lipoprotein-sorting protein [Deltaproteobacteria bacterium]|nr:outer membrane lipoprotein-sorting protein [Deltaproteobacteria bacterium]
MRITRQQSLLVQVSNGDVVATDYHYSYQSELVGEEVVEDKLCYKLKLVRRWPFVPYPKITCRVEKDTYRPIKVEFYLTSDTLMKVGYYRSYREALEDIRPNEVLIENAQVKSSYTKILYSKSEFADIPDEYYQPAYLVRMR